MDTRKKLWFGGNYNGLKWVSSLTTELKEGCHTPNFNSNVGPQGSTGSPNKVNNGFYVKLKPNGLTLPIVTYLSQKLVYSNCNQRSISCYLHHCRSGSKIYSMCCKQGGLECSKWCQFQTHWPYNDIRRLFHIFSALFPG